MSVLILEAKDGTLFAVCSQHCAMATVRHRNEPDYILKPVDGPQPGVRFGCWFCGGDLTEGVQWLTGEREA